MNRARSYLALLALAPALVGWNPFVRRNPEVRRGAEAYAEGQYDRALESFERAEEKVGAVPEVSLGKGAALYKAGDLQAARADDPKLAAASKQVYEQAAQAFQGALAAADPKLKARAYYNLGNARARAGEPKEAIESYVKALMLDPDHQDAKANLELARLYLEQQRNKKQPRESDKGEKQEQESEDKEQQRSRSQEDSAEQREPKPDPEQQAQGEEPRQEPQDAKRPTPQERAESTESRDPLAQPREGEMSPEEAERLLDSLRREEVNLQHWNRMMEEYKDRKTVVERDW